MHVTMSRLAPRSVAAMTAIGLSAGIAGAQGAAAPAAPAPAAPAEAAAAPAYAPQKVVYHLNGPAGEDGKGYAAALNNIRNHLEAVGKDNIDLRVVLHGDGVELLQRAAADQALQGTVIDLRNQGVRFLVCNNTLTGRHIAADSLFEVQPEDIVPSGVAELAKLQTEGFAYIKP